MKMETLSQDLDQSRWSEKLAVTYNVAVSHYEGSRTRVPTEIPVLLVNLSSLASARLVALAGKGEYQVGCALPLNHTGKKSG